MKLSALRATGDGKWVIVERPDERRVGRWFLVMALATAVLAAALMMVESEAWPVWLFPMSFGLVGWLYAVRGGLTEIDGSRKEVVAVGDRDRTKGYVAVMVGAGIQQHQTEHGSVAVLAFGVSLVLPDVDPEAAEMVAKMREALDSTEGLSEAGRADLTAALEQWGPVMRSEQLHVMTTTDEHLMWRIGEWLARTLDVPMIDFAGGRPMQRTPAELDRTLVQRLEGMPEEDRPPSPGAPPPGIELDELPQRLALTWYAGVGGQLFGMVLFIGFALFGVVLAIEGALFIGLSFFVVGLGLAALIAWAGRTTGNSELVIDATKLHHTGGFPFRRIVEIPLSALEHVREQPNPRPMLSFVSDDVLLQIGATDEQAAWIRRKVEHHLGARIGRT